MRRIGVLLACLMLSAVPVTAQSLFASQGLGVPADATDARARILGGLGIGLLGPNVSLVNPASPAGTLRKGFSAVMVTTPGTMSQGNQHGYVTSTRFPLIRAVLPIGTRWVVTAAYGGYLDQDWSVRSDRQEAIGADTVPVRDIVRSSGGVGQYRLGLAYSLGSRLAVGVAAGGYSGQQQILVSRQFTDTTTLTEVESFQSRLARSYSAPMISAGLRWDPASFARLGASVTLPGRLKMNAEQGQLANRTVPLPVQVAGGASAYLSPDLLLAASARWSGWSKANTALMTTNVPAGVPAARDTWEIGGGLEYASTARQSRTMPLRLGFRYAQLPFSFDGQLPTEWAVGGGFGLRVGPRLDPQALIDVGVERGARGSSANGNLHETFWQISLSVSLFSR
ncbi:MAG: hypothetical protein P8174_05075 [Gemmatimonadota bacterium]